MLFVIFCSASFGAMPNSFRKSLLKRCSVKEKRNILISTIINMIILALNNLIQAFNETCFIFIEFLNSEIYFLNRTTY